VNVAVDFRAKEEPHSRELPYLLDGRRGQRVMAEDRPNRADLEVDLPKILSGNKERRRVSLLYV